MASPVEVQYGMTSYGGSNSSGTRVYGSNVTAGNYSVVLVQSLGNPCSTGAVTDSQGNSYVLLTFDAANDDVAIWAARIASSAACTVTYTIPGGGTNTEFAIAAVEVSVSAGKILAKHDADEGAGSSTTPATGSLVTSLDTLMLALVNVDIFETPSAAGGFTQRATAAWPQRPASLIARSAAAGTYTPSWTMTGSAYVWRAASIALSEVTPGLRQATFANGGQTGTTTSTKRTSTFSTYLIENNTIALSATALVDHAVTINNWRIRLTVAPGVGVTRTFTVYKNGSATALVVAISGTNQTGSDLTHSVSFVAGDTTYVEQTISGTPADTLVQSVFECVNPDGYTSLFGFGEATTSLSSTTFYNGFLYGGEWGATANRIENVVATPGTITGYRLKLSVAPGTAASGKVRTFVIEKNGTAQDGTGGTPNTTITCTETATTGSATFSLSVIAGDLIRLKMTATNSPAISACNGTGTFVATTLGQYNMGGTTDDQVSTSASEYHAAFGNFGIGAGAWGATESLRENIGPETTLTVSGLYVNLSAAPGAGKNYVITLRKNTADATQDVTISDANTIATSSGNVVLFTSADRVSLRSTPSGTPTGTYIRWAWLMTDPGAADIRLTQEYVEALTQNAAADIRLTQMRVEALAQSTTVEIRLTQMRVEVLQSSIEAPRGTSVWIGDGGGIIWTE